MCNRARLRSEPETLEEHLGAEWSTDIPNRWPIELTPKRRAPIIRSQEAQRVIDLMAWDVLGGQAPWPMTNVRALGLKQWRALAADPAKRCLVPLTEFCEWTPFPIDIGDGRKPIRGEMWFEVMDQTLFAVAGLWQNTVNGPGFAMVTCDPNDLVEPIHPKAMLAILRRDDHDRWLNGSYEDVRDLQRAYPAEQMTVRGPAFPTRQPALQDAALLAM